MYSIGRFAVGLFKKKVKTAIPSEAHECGKVVRPTYQPCLPPPPHQEKPLVLIPFRVLVDPRVRLEGPSHLKTPMTPSGIEPATYMDYVLSGILVVIATFMWRAMLCNEFLHHSDCPDLLIVQASNLFSQLFINTPYIFQTQQRQNTQITVLVLLQ